MNYFKFGIVALAVSLAFYWGYRVGNKECRRSVLINESLLHLSPRHVQIPNSRSARRDSESSGSGRQRQTYVPKEGSVVITPKDPTKKLEDVVNIDFDRYGFTFRPGIYGSFMPGGLGIDAKLAYANRWGVVAGVMYRNDYDTLSPTVGISYAFGTRFFMNTEFVGGLVAFPYNTGFVGMRINF